MIGTKDRTFTETLGTFLRRVWADQGLRWAVGLFLILRVITGFVAVQSVYIYKLPADPVHHFVQPWDIYDTSWYTRIAVEGYLPGRSEIAFPPLFPALIRLAMPLAGDYSALASLLISNISCIVALWLLYRLVIREFDSSALASRTLICLVAFPTGYYLLAGYTESPFLALVLGAWLATLDRRWWLAGLLALLAGLMRIQGAILCFPLAWIAYVEQREPGWRALLARSPAVVGAAIGTLSWMAYIRLENLGSLAQALMQEWALQTKLPWYSVASYVVRLAAGRTESWENINAVGLVFVIALGLVVTFRFRVPYALWVWGNLMLILMRFRPEPFSQFESLIRYTLALFPCFILLAMMLRRWWLILPYVGAASYVQILFLSRFVNAIWVA